MLSNDQVEELISLVACMDRFSLAQQFQSYPSRFPIDFTEDFLENAPLERLRHIFVALCLHDKHMPAMETSVV